MARILLVDDDQGIRSLVSQALERIGHQVVAFDDAWRAEDWLRAECPDMVITDLVMPTPGTTLVRSVRESYPSLPVVVLSGFLPDHDLAELEAMGTTRFMEKPLRVPELVSVVNLILESAGGGDDDGDDDGDDALAGLAPD